MARTDDGRAYVQYVDDSTGEVSLPGYLNANPGVVSPGDVTLIDEAFLEEITSTDRFVEADAPKDDEVSANAALTKSQLADKLNAGRDESDPDVVDPAAYSKDDLVALADEYDRTHPTPAGAVGDNATEGNESR